MCSLILYFGILRHDDRGLKSRVRVSDLLSVSIETWFAQFNESECCVVLRQLVIASSPSRFYFHCCIYFLRWRKRTELNFMINKSLRYMYWSTLYT